MVTIDELLKNEIARTSFTRVADFLLQLIAEKNAQEHLASPSTTDAQSASSEEQAEK